MKNGSILAQTLLSDTPASVQSTQKLNTLGNNYYWFIDGINRKKTTRVTSYNTLISFNPKDTFKNPGRNAIAKRTFSKTGNLNSCLVKVNITLALYLLLKTYDRITFNSERKTRQSVRL